MEAGQLWRQYIVAGIANTLVLSLGYCMGWTAPMNSLLTDPDRADESPLDRIPTTDELAWMGALINIGAIVGPFIGGFLAGKIGRKWGLLSGVIPLLVGWILVALANEIAMIYAGRICWGLALGMAFAITPMYCAEIATIERRGALGSIMQLFLSSGFLLVYVVGPFASYLVVSIVGIVVTSLFAILFFFMPDSPTYHLLQGNKERAAQSLMTLRGRSRAGVESELRLIASDVAASMKRTATFADLFRGVNFKAFYMSCTLVFFLHFCGINAVLFYMTDIFRAAGLDIPHIATIIVGAVQVGASAVTPMVVDRLGRRIMHLISSSGAATGLALLGMYFVLQEVESPVVESISFLPVLALIIFIIAFCWGLRPLPWAVMSELFPIEVKTVAAPITTAFAWALSFLVTMSFPLIAANTGMYVGFFVFFACCIAAILFTLFVLPETKGKKLQEIRELLGERKQNLEKA